MTIITSAMVWHADNVKTFRGYDVVGGEVSLNDSEYVEVLNDIYGEVVVCGQTFDSGSILQDQDPTAFRCGKGDYESDLQSELENQLEREDDDNIEFEIEPSDINEDEEEDEE